MTREQLIEKMARAASESFKARISKSADMPFAETGVTEPSMAIFCDYAASALSAIQAAGLAVVPVEATEAMIDGFGRRWRSDLGSGDGTLFPKHQRGELVWKTSLPRHD